MCIFCAYGTHYSRCISSNTCRDQVSDAQVSTETTQTLMDGTHVSHATTLMEYRDGEGRVRTETSEPAVSDHLETLKSGRLAGPRFFREFRRGGASPSNGQRFS